MLKPLPKAGWNYETAAHLLNRAGFGGPPEEIGNRLFGGWMAREIEITQSKLSSAGARHTRLAAFPLGL